MSVTAPLITPYGDGAVIVEYDVQGYDADVVDHIHGLAEKLRRNAEWENIVPGYNSLLVTFNPAVTEMDSTVRHLKRAISTLSARPISAPLASGDIMDIPVVYGGEFGPDMDVIQTSSGLSVDAIIALHSGQTYRVCMMGFIPGFSFLSEAPKALHHPRRQTPRLSVPPGSVGIAGWQTGIYGLSSPGGWQIIGRTPLRVFDAARAQPFALKAGDQVRFVPSGAEIFSRD